MDKLGDPFEGSLPSTEGQDYLDQYNWLIREYKTINPIPNSETPYTMPYYLRKNSYVCSFHVSSFESAALWSLYTKAKQGVAIQSTYKRLCECFNDYHENDVYIGQVKYIDYTTDKIPLSPNIMTPLVCKRKSFEYEKELRALIFFPQQFRQPPEPGTNISVKEIVEKQPPGFHVPVNLDILIENIYIAPTTQSWVNELMSSLIKNFGIDKKILQSDLDKEPII